MLQLVKGSVQYFKRILTNKVEDDTNFVNDIRSAFILTVSSLLHERMTETEKLRFLVNLDRAYQEMREERLDLLEREVGWFEKERMHLCNDVNERPRASGDRPAAERASSGSALCTEGGEVNADQ